VLHRAADGSAHHPSPLQCVSQIRRRFVRWVDAARARSSHKRGRGAERVTLDEGLSCHRNMTRVPVPGELFIVVLRSRGWYRYRSRCGWWNCGRLVEPLLRESRLVQPIVRSSELAELGLREPVGTTTRRGAGASRRGDEGAGGVAHPLAPVMVAKMCTPGGAPIWGDRNEAPFYMRWTEAGNGADIVRISPDCDLAVIRRNNRR
jgi:hypothetical protein